MPFSYKPVRPLVLVRVAVFTAVLMLAIAGVQFTVFVASTDGGVPPGAVRGVIAGCIAALLAAAAVSWMIATRFSRPTMQLEQSVRAMIRDLSVRPEVLGDGEIAGLRRALDALAASLEKGERERERFKKVLAVMIEGVLVTDASGTVVLTNRALREMFVTGRDLTVTGSGALVRLPNLRETMREALKARAPRTAEFVVQGPNPRRVMVRAAPLDDDLTGMLAILSDVTDLRRLETVRSDFVANVSHELRTPIAAVHAAVETLQGGALARPEAAQKFVEVIARHTLRLRRLVEDLLELSRIEAKELQLTLEEIELRPIVTHIIELLTPVADQRQIRLVWEFGEGGSSARADHASLEHVISNLVDNAIKYSPEGATVKLRADAHEKDWIRISVTDDGPGIAAEHLPRLFERFYRVDPGRSRKVGGTGLGLAIVKHLAEAMGGRVSVESTPGSGSRFHVDLRRA